MATTQTPARATSFVTGIGANIDSLLGRDVILHSCSIDTRPVGKNPETPFAIMEISEVGGDEVATYHVSGAVVNKLAEVPLSAYPVTVKFVKTRGSSGFSFYNIE